MKISVNTRVLFLIITMVQVPVVVSMKQRELSDESDEPKIVQKRFKGDLRKILLNALKANDHAKLAALIVQDPEIAKSEWAENVTALHRAASYRAGKCVMPLVNAGLEVNCLNSYFQTPLHTACSEVFDKFGKVSDVSCVKALLEAKADVHAKAKRGKTLGGFFDREASLFPIHIAAWTGNAECVSALLTAGADVEAVTAGKQTAIDCRFSNLSEGDLESAELLVDACLKKNEHLVFIELVDGRIAVPRTHLQLMEEIVASKKKDWYRAVSRESWDALFRELKKLYIIMRLDRQEESWKKNDAWLVHSNWQKSLSTLREWKNFLTVQVCRSFMDLPKNKRDKLLETIRDLKIPLPEILAFFDMMKEIEQEFAEADIRKLIFEQLKLIK